MKTEPYYISIYSKDDNRPCQDECTRRIVKKKETSAILYTKCVSTLGKHGRVWSAMVQNVTNQPQMIFREKLLADKEESCNNINPFSVMTLILVATPIKAIFRGHPHSLLRTDV